MLLPIPKYSCFYLTQLNLGSDQLVQFVLETFMMWTHTRAVREAGQMAKKASQKETITSSISYYLQN